MSSGLSLITRGRGIALAAAMLAATAVAPLSASAHFLNFPNHRWAFTNGSQYLLNLYYERDCASDWWTPDSAANAWTGTATPLDYHYSGAPDCSGVEMNRIRILNGSAVGSGLAWTENYNCGFYLWGTCFFWDYNFAQPSQIDASLIYENHYNNNYDNLNSGERADVIKHEMGHSMGLRHAGYYGGESPDWRGYPYGVYSIMDYCCPSDYTGWPYFVPSTPTAHDTSDINTLYPSWYW
jgi:hypothetical protein